MAFTPAETVTFFDAERKRAEAASAHVEAALLHAASTGDRTGDLSESAPTVDGKQDLLRRAAEATDDAARLDESFVQGNKRLAAQADFVQQHADIAEQVQVVQDAVRGQELDAVDAALREGKEVGSPTATPATGARIG